MAIALRLIKNAHPLPRGAKVNELHPVDRIKLLHDLHMWNEKLSHFTVTNFARVK